MTVLSNYSPAGGLGNGVTTVFPCGWRCLDESHLVVVKTLISSGLETTLVLDTDYTVQNAGTADDAQVTLTVALSALYSLSIVRDTPILQEVDLRPQGPYEADTIETMFDRLTMIAQEERYRLEVLEALGDLVTVSELADAVEIGTQFVTEPNIEDTFPFNIACPGGATARTIVWQIQPEDPGGEAPFNEPPQVDWVPGADVITVRYISGLESDFDFYTIKGLVFFE